MHSDERGSAAGSGVLIAVIVVAAAVVCGGGALVLTAAMLFTRVVHQSIPPPPPVAAVEQANAAAQIGVDVLQVEADGTLNWNGLPVERAELTQRLDALKDLPGPPRSVVLRMDKNAQTVTLHEILQMLADRQLAYIIEDQK